MSIKIGYTIAKKNPLRFKNCRFLLNWKFLAFRSIRVQRICHFVIQTYKNFTVCDDLFEGSKYTKNKLQAAWFFFSEVNASTEVNCILENRYQLCILSSMDKVIWVNKLVCWYNWLNINVGFIAPNFSVWMLSECYK